MVQKQTANVITSGVLFTRTPDIGAPYYVINFEDGKDTDSVTKGLVGNTIKIFRKISLKDVPNKWKNLVLSVMEIEQILWTRSFMPPLLPAKIEIVILRILMLQISTVRLH